MKIQISKSKFQKFGFTLLELLVVIAIIGTFLAVGIGSFSTAQKKARDTKRKTDLREIHNALEQYYSVCGSTYPVPTGLSSEIVCSSPSLAIMPIVPQDPRGGSYYCGPTPDPSRCSQNGYTICANLESETVNYYCISNSQ
jgi:prepilin-type N-terminal cleavage/methylation domain-containing protein